MNTILFISFSLFTLFDFYSTSMGGRFFDYFAIPFLFIFLLINKNLNYDSKDLIFFGLFPSLILGIILGNLVQSLWVIFGAFFIFKLFSQSTIDIDKLKKQILLLICIHLIFFYVQYYLYYLFDFPFNFFAFGSEASFNLRQAIPYQETLLIQPRIYQPDISFFRASGLFQEPNSFSTLILFLYSIFRLIQYRYFNNKVGILDFFVIISLILCESLFGIFIAAFHILYLGYLFLKSKPKIFIFLVPLIFLIGVSTYDQYDTILQLRTVDRIFNIQGDSSWYVRIVPNVAAGPYEVLFGNGFTLDNFGNKFGVNTFSFMLNAFGIIGIVFFFYWFFSFVGFKFLPTTYIVILFLTYPYFMYGIFWAWVALMVQIYKNDINSKESIIYD